MVSPSTHFLAATLIVLLSPLGCLNFTDENDEVLISGFGRRGKAKGDIPGVRFKVVKVSGVGLLALWKEKKWVFACAGLSSELTDDTKGETEVMIVQRYASMINS